jgi:hypothetical protein
LIFSSVHLYLVGNKYAMAPLATHSNKQVLNGTVTQKRLQIFYEAAELVGLLAPDDIFACIRA